MRSDDNVFNGVTTVHKPILAHLMMTCRPKYIRKVGLIK
jgi:hypothetical protein